MAKRYLLCFFIVFPFFSIAQYNLSGSRQTSVYTYVYKLNNKEALSLAGSNMYRLSEKYLHALVDSFRTKDVDEPELQPGNYLYVYAKGNKLETELKTVGDLQYKLINNDRGLVLALHNKPGQFVRDAEVYIGNRKVPYDETTQTFRLAGRRKAGLIKVYYKGVLYFFPLSKNPVRRYFWPRVVRTFPIKYVRQLLQRMAGRNERSRNYFYSLTPYERKYRGYVVFNKPVFKTGDTVKLKAFITKKSGRPVNRPLLVRLSNQGFGTDTIIATIHPYRPGGYEYRFIITDSMDLDLDENFIITLEELHSRKYDLDEYDGNLDEEEYVWKRKILVKGKFRHEDYELTSTTFTARTDKKEHNRGNTAAIYLKATDENDMAIMDGRVEIVITPTSYGTKEFRAPHVFLRDTLWKHEQLLEAVGETKIVIPDSIFPAADFAYSIHCTFLNSNNEFRDKTLQQHFYNSRQAIEIKQQQDSLFIQLIEAGKSVAADAMVYAYSKDDDTLQQLPVHLPATIAINPYVDYYEVETDSTWEEYRFEQSQDMISCIASRTKDSISVLVSNPARLKFWYTIYAGNKAVAKGYSDSLYYLDRTITPKNYFVSLQYVFGNKVNTEKYTVPYRSRLLNIQVSQPEYIYPGKTTTIDVTVSDATGNPVANTDVTAYAFTKKFTDVRIPDVPYFGKLYPGLKRYGSFYPAEDKDMQGAIKLNWNRWSKEMGLDSIEYFRFLHPKTIYVNREPAKDSITQIAPFVVIDGELQPVHQIYIDEVPVFFSQAQQMQRYSFNVRPGRHSLRLRTHKQLIWVDSIWATRGMKTFIAVRGDTSEYWSLRSEKMPDTLTNYEKNLWSKYMILMEKNFGENMAYVAGHNYAYLLNNAGNRYYDTRMLVGPLTDGYNKFAVKNKFSQSFEREGNYHYVISHGLIKQKQLPYGRYAFRSYLEHETPVYNFRDFVLTEKEIDSLWTDYLDTRSANEDLFTNSKLGGSNNGLLQVEVEKGEKGEIVFVKNIFLFRYDYPDYIRVYKGTARNLGYVQPGVYRLFLLLKGNRYFIKDSVRIQPHGINYYSTGTIVPHEKDSISTKISDIINNREKPWSSYTQSEGDLTVITETFNGKYLDAVSFDRAITGRITSSGSGVPLAGVTVTVKGTRFGTVTDAQGFFRLNVPAHAVIVVSFVGFVGQEHRLTNEDTYDIKLHEATNNLSEVVVVGYGTQRKKEVTASITTISAEEITNSLQGRVAGIMIRGMSSVKMDSVSPLIIVDGLPYSGQLTDLEQSQILDMSTLDATAATAIWGSRAANGVIVITTKKATDAKTLEEKMQEPGNSLRKNFRDDAFWQPRLLTDEAGKTSFTVTYPDDITNWRTFFIAMNGNRQSGFKELSVRSVKLLSGSIALPQFAVAGDSINIIGKTLNYGVDTIEVKRSFSIDKKPVQENTFKLTNSRIDTFLVTVPAQDSLQLAYTIQKTDGYFDGEERSIPVFKTGVLETTGFFAALDKDTSLTIPFTRTTETIKVYAEASVLPVLLDEMEKLRVYEYLCNEQLASKLKALLLKKKVYHYLNKDFREEKNINEIISRLNKAKALRGLWGWWDNTEPLPWVSLHVIEALLLAEKEGYRTNINKQQAIDYTVFVMEDNKGGDRLTLIQLLQLLDAKADVKKYITEFEAKKPLLNLYETLRLLELKQLAGMPVQLDTLLPKQHRTMFGNVYWGEENYRFFDNSVQNTVLMYRLLKRAGEYENVLQKIRNYFLEKRKDGKWRNTYESSLILETILPDLLKNNPANDPASIVINGGTPVTTFPYSTTLPAAEQLTVSKRGAMPVYFTAYEQHWNANPQKVNSDFVVNSTFEKNGDTILALKAGEPVSMKIKVIVKADADYVMVEAPIPAGCSYKDKQQSYSNNEVHREHFKNKVSIFCSSLKKGEYVFTVSLLPRYTGAYHLNPAKAEMMYFPVFYGREGMKKVKIY